MTKEQPAGEVARTEADESGEVTLEVPQEAADRLMKSLVEQGFVEKGAGLAGIRVANRQTFSGPLPPPQELAGYKQVDPTLPDRIFAMADSHRAHEQEMDRERLKAQNQERELYYGTIREQHQNTYRVKLATLGVATVVTIVAAICLGIAVDRDIAWLIYVSVVLLSLMTSGGLYGAVKVHKSQSAEQQGPEPEP